MTAQKWLRRASFVPVAGMAFIATQLVRVVHRPDLPSLSNQDPSGSWGANGLPSLRIVALGDSSVTAPGVKPLDDAWVRRVAIDLSDDWKVELHSVAGGGAKARDVLAGQVGQAVGLRPGLALVAIGANDAMRATNLRRFEAEMTQILSKLSAASRTVVTLGIGDLGTIPRLPPSLAYTVTRRGRLVNDVIRRAADRFENVAPVNPWETMTRFSSKDPRLWASDLFHASGEGHAIFYQGAIPTIRRALVNQDM